MGLGVGVFGDGGGEVGVVFMGVHFPVGGVVGLFGGGVGCFVDLWGVQNSGHNCFPGGGGPVGGHITRPRFMVGG